MQSLKINGQEYDVKFSYSVILAFCERQGIELYEYSEQMAKVNFDRMTNAGVKIIGTLIHCAIERGCETSGVPCTLSVNDIIDAIFTDENLLPAAMKAIQNDMPVKKKENLPGEMNG